MSASCIITSLSFILLLATICCQLIAFLTSHVISNNFDSRMHEGIYQRCGLPFNSILGSQTNIGAYFGFMPACSWWNSRMFEFDPVSLRAIAILGFISFATLGIVFMIGLLSLADRLKTRGLQVFLGVLMILNVAILVTIILVYTLVYAKDVKLISANEPLTFTNRVFSWSYWFLYAAAGLSLITSVFLCFNPVRSYKQ